MNFNKVTENDINTLWRNKDRKIIINMETDQKAQYMSLYNVYRLLFTDYIINKLNIKNYDKKIEESKLNFTAVSEENMDIYQYYSKDELKYFYLRNNIYINSLSDEEKEFLNKKVNDNNIKLDDETTKFIEDTFVKAIYEGEKEENKVYSTLYGPDSKNYMAPNNALVIGMRYNEFDSNGLNDEEWKDLYIKKSRFLNNFIKEMENDINNNFGTKVCIIKYNDYSIIQLERKTWIKNEYGNI